MSHHLYIHVHVIFGRSSQALLPLSAHSSCGSSLGVFCSLLIPLIFVFGVVIEEICGSLSLRFPDSEVLCFPCVRLSCASLVTISLHICSFCAICGGRSDVERGQEGVNLGFLELGSRGGGGSSVCEGGAELLVGRIGRRGFGRRRRVPIGVSDEAVDRGFGWIAVSLGHDACGRQRQRWDDGIGIWRCS